MIRFPALLVLTLSAPALAATPVVVLDQGNTWTYLDTGVDPDPTWTELSFDDAAWLSGTAPLGYGIFGGTTIDNGGDPANVHVTSWFRKSFTIADPGDYTGLTMDLQRDDGAVVYLNGTEVSRSNMPASSTSATYSSTDISGLEETTFASFAVDHSLLVAGDNQVAVEVHQSAAFSDDLAFDLFVTAWTGPAAIVRGPYLQNATPTSVVVRWRTDLPTEGEVVIDGRTLTSPLGTDHEVEVTGLDASTTYSYTVGTPDGVLSGEPTDPLHEVKTLPLAGATGPIRMWVVGDSGTANVDAERVRDAFVALGEPADVWLMLGDNAYNSGTDVEYQAAVFDMYGDILPNTPLWSTLGNHDGYSASSASQTGPYYDIFTLPVAGEAGGEPSGTEAYYSIDVGNIHIICLDSYDSDRTVGSAMLDWLEDDLSTTSAEWILAFWHHPPYSKGSHNSDIEGNMVDMRQNALPVLEAYGVDLVMTGHSHSYERSMLVDGHYEDSSTFDTTMQRNASSGDPTIDGAYTKPSVSGGSHEGAVYMVAGSSGKISGGTLDHPIMHASMSVLGSVVLDIDGGVLEARFIDDYGVLQDAFTMERGVTSVLEMSVDGPVEEAVEATLHAYAQDPDGNEAVAYAWDFGDGSPTGYGADVMHTWPDDGTYPVTVTATDLAGDDAVRVLNLDVINIPPEITDVGSDPASEGVPVKMWATATDVSNDPVELSWDFGDGSSAYGSDVEHLYTRDGTYTVTVTATDDEGDSSEASFDLVVEDLPIDQQVIYVSGANEGGITVLSAENDPEAITWSWDLFDGLAARTSPTIEHIWLQDGAKPVALTVTDAEGDSSTTVITVQVANVAPSDLQVSQPFGGDEGEILAFTASASDPGDDLLDYTWNFGDGSFAAVGASVQHAFTDDGLFEVEVTVDDGDGGSDTLAFGINISNVAPRFTTFQAPTSLAEGEEGMFLAIGEDPGSFDNDDVTWDFGDGTNPIITNEVRKTFPLEGLYNVTATLDDGDGQVVVQQATVQVRNAPPRFLSTPGSTATTGIRYTYPSAVEELGQDTLTYTLVGPEGANVGPLGVVGWTPTRPEAAVPFTLTVSDGTDVAVQSWTVDAVGVGQGTQPTSNPRVSGGGGGCGCTSAMNVGFPALFAGLLPWIRRRR